MARPTARMTPDLPLDDPTDSAARREGAPAQWRPCSDDGRRACDRACHATLRWPVRNPDPDTPQTRPDAWPAEPRTMVALPAVPTPPHSMLALLGEAGLRRLVRRHMARLRLTPLLADPSPTTPATPDCFDCVTERVGDFVVESCGGPLYWSAHHGPHSGLNAGAGWPVLLDEVGRDIWLVQLWHACDDVGLSPRLRADLWAWAEPLSLHLLVPRARRTAVRRYPHHTVQGWFATATP